LAGEVKFENYHLSGLGRLDKNFAPHFVSINSNRSVGSFVADNLELGDTSVSRDVAQQRVDEIFNSSPGESIVGLEDESLRRSEDDLLDVDHHTSYVNSVQSSRLTLGRSLAEDCDTVLWEVNDWVDAVATRVERVTITLVEDNLNISGLG